MDAIIKWITDNLPLFIGIVAAAVVLIVLIVVIAVHAAKKRKKKRPEAASFAAVGTASDGESDPAAETTSAPVSAETADGEQDIVYDGVEITETAAPPDEEIGVKETVTPEKAETEEADQPQASAEQPSDESVGKAEEADRPQAAAEQPSDESAGKAEEAPVPVAAVCDGEDAAEREKPSEETGPAKKTAAKSPASKTAAKQTRRTTGKWTIEIKSAGEYMAKLSASNGEVMLSSEIYSSEEGARNGIGTIVKCIENGKFVVYQDKNKNYYYKLKTANNRLLCVGEIYRSKDQCEKAVETVRRIAASAVVYDDVAEGSKYIEYTPLKVESYDVKKGVRGKWKVETTEDGKFSAKLYASNGQLMLATEEVALRKTAENAIEAVKRNSAAGNFIIDRDKFGRYYYKLRNPQKSVICIGEAYDSLDSCTSALESVRRFAATAVMPNETE